MNGCTIVVPCFNEAGRLDRRAFQDFLAHDDRCRFLLVNDGSRDGTQLLLDAMAADSPARVGAYHLPRNGGKAEAVRLGILRALDDDPPYVGYWDAALATPLDAIPEFCDLLDRDPRLLMVLGSRVKLLGRTIERRAVRHYLGRVFATLASLVLRLPVYDTQCGAKMFRVTPETKAVFAEPFRSRWIFDVELLARLHRAWQREGRGPFEQALCELPLRRWRDVAGSSLRWRHMVRAPWELAVIYWAYRDTRSE